MWSDGPLRLAYAPEPSRTQAPDAKYAEAVDDGPGIDLISTTTAETEAPETRPEPNITRAGQAETLAVAHVERCHDRYRSYRPEDNSYQPNGGGPRRQCI